MRCKLTLEYDGRLFSGWQRQPGIPTVQQTIEEALERLCGWPVQIYGAGRTDQGVHASGQVAHFDLPVPLSLDNVRRGLNFYLKNQGVGVVEAEFVPQDFHARFSATFRSYTYTLLNRPSPPVLEEGRVWWVHQKLDVEAMTQAATLLQGHHNFAAFRSKTCGSLRTYRTLDHLKVDPQGPHLFFHIQARAFLHQQVRIMVGTLKHIGEGKAPSSLIPQLLEEGVRAAAGPTAPAEGLCLVKVGY